MRRKDILELKRRLKKEECTFTKVCGCYVNGEKHTILKFRESFLNLDDDEYFKYLEIAKKVLSGTIGNNILKLNFSTNEDFTNERQTSLMQLKNSQLKDDAFLDNLYDLIIANYDYTGNFLILFFHDAYDVISKTKDNARIDESEEVYEYVLCAICPVSLSEPGLGYFEEQNEIKARVRDWVVESPINGFVFPAFIDRSSDVNSIMYYTKNAKDTHTELMENVLGCDSKKTATVQKETFQSIIKDSFSEGDDKADKVFMDIQENLSSMIEEYNDSNDDAESEPISLTKKDIQNLLIDSEVPREITTMIENSYVENFGDDSTIAKNLIDTKALKANVQRKKEEHLHKQVETLQARLDQVKQVKEENTIDKEAQLSTEVSDDNVILEEAQATDLEESLETTLEKVPDTLSEDNNVTPQYDVVLQVKPEKVSQIKSQIINGQKCIVIPINDNEQTTVNGVDNLI
ncbi:DUF4317 domain-containing protein [Clostridium psychrophilum]|uniref:DUF4317 domain-containing protein n=1 Tax=Clostridium psychrophilum TaxID=132926 RepID=UPI001C0D6959|nr:DUF4317 domain-containing protein [Clostridium psychrophilum]MBU3182966.1 DUF4317 domain-containing protein [Clostridium psychrophilum]